MHQGGYVDFQIIPDADAGALMSASRLGFQIFYRLRESFSPELFPQSYRKGAVFGITAGNKRPRAAMEMAKSKRPALAGFRKGYIPSSEVSTCSLGEERTEQTDQAGGFEDTL